MIRLILARHGESIWHAENRYAGKSDIALTQRGLDQAVELAQWAKAENLSSVWSSSLMRARLTAQPVADLLQVPLQIDDGLNELDFGRGEGLTDKEMRERFPLERKAFLQNPVNHYLPGGEDPSLATKRGIDALTRIRERSEQNARVLLVAHSTLIRLMLCDLLGIPLSHYRSRFPRLDNGTIAELMLSDEGASLLSFNSPFTVQNRANRDHVKQ
jgi:broad specificity phosphatase PhoE